MIYASFGWNEKSKTTSFLNNDSPSFNMLSNKPISYQESRGIYIGRGIVNSIFKNHLFFLIFYHNDIVYSCFIPGYS